MKKITVLAGILVMSTGAFAKINNPDFINQKNIQNSKSSKKQVAKGIRLSLSQSTLKIEIKDDGETSNKVDLDTNAQFSIGYTDINLGQVGFMGEFSYLQIDTDEDDVSNTRLSGNATYGINENIYTFAGVNISKFNVDTNDTTTSNNTTDYDAGFGYQVGFGAQVNKNLALEVAYISLNSSMSSIEEIETYDSVDDTYSYTSLTSEADILTTGIQVNLVGTF
jgi:hypothetical protein